MAIQRYAGDKIVGLSTDIKPLNVSNGAVFYETDTLKNYIKVGGVWSEMTGTSGFSGTSGERGYSGYSGTSGATGDSGSSGVSGYSGVQGFSGISGTSGAKGDSGYSGTSGEKGDSGFSGVSGAKGDSGVSGYSGSTANFVGRKLLANTQSASDFVGTSGDNSKDVTTIMSGKTPVTSASTDEGVIIDAPKNTVVLRNAADKNPIVDSVGNEYYGRLTYESGNIWLLTYYVFYGGSEVAQVLQTTQNIEFMFPERFNLDTVPEDFAQPINFSDEPGLQGYSGTSGATGASGFSGTSGAKGDTGDSGYSGVSGATGVDGASGYSGVSGATGVDGASGFSGVSGATGTSGYSGVSGATGAGIQYWDLESENVLTPSIPGQPVDLKTSPLYQSAASAPSTPPADNMVMYVTATGVSPNRVIKYCVKDEVGNEIIITSVVV